MANEQVIWNYLLDKIQNPYGVAGLMGNLYVESKLNPMLLQSSYAKKLGMTSQQYTEAVDNGSYTNFIHDSAGYGLVQWTYWSRKEGLYNYVKSRGKSIGDLNVQLDYLWKEIQTYKTCLNTLKTATSVSEASFIVTERYEKPADLSEKGKLNRANFGQNYFDLFSTPCPTQENSSKKVVVTKDRVNVRTGNGKEFTRIFLANSGSSYDWVATADNGWHAVKLNKQVGWISGEFSKIKA